MTVDPRRQASVRALVDVHKGRDLEQTLNGLRQAIDDPQGAGVAEEMVRGALQFRDRYQHVVLAFSRRGASPDAVVQAVLHLSLHELLTHDRVPVYATLHQAGEILRAEGKNRQVGYVNAVLQTVQRHAAAAEGMTPLDAIRSVFGDMADEAAALASWWSHPRWLVERWLRRFGATAVEALLQHANTPPPITLHVLPRADREAVAADLQARGLACAEVPGYPRALHLTSRVGRATLTELLSAHPQVLVQDAGAQALVDWLTRDGDALAALPGPLLDLCAAPGGKTAHLRAWLPSGHTLVAMDRQRRRMRRLGENARRLGLADTPLLVGDGCAPPLRPASCGAVLIDGPCSGTGVGRHHPEGRWRLRLETIQGNAERLLELTLSAADLLAPGGSLYYATCSLEPEENEEVLQKVLEARPDLVPDPDPDGAWYRTWCPWETGTDGFFAGRLCRRPQAEVSR